MATPNVVNVATILGKTTALAVTTTPTNIIENTSGSGKVYKINMIRISNVDGTNSASITASFYRLSTEYPIASVVAVPAKNSLDVLDKGVSIYLEEADAIRLTASANGDLVAVASYEEIS